MESIFVLIFFLFICLIYTEWSKSRLVLCQHVKNRVSRVMIHNAVISLELVLIGTFFGSDGITAHALHTDPVSEGSK